MAIGDQNLPQISFLGLPQTTEASEWVTFTIELSEPSPTPIQLFYRTVPGSADDNGVDLNTRLDDIQIAANTTVATFQVYTIHDTDPERDEFYFVELFNPAGATFGGRNHSLRATGWILDNDPGGGQNAMAVTAPVVLEGAGAASFTVSLSEAAASDTIVRYSTVADSAKAGTDFVADSGTVTILAGEREATVDIALRNDSAREAGEAFGLAVSASGGRTGFARATILDNDGPEPSMAA